MPLLETRGSGSAIAFGLNASTKLIRTGPSITVRGAGLNYATDGSRIYIEAMSNWGAWKNLPAYLQNAPATSVINTGDAIMGFSTSGNIRVWLVRQTGWSPVSTSGWTLSAGSQLPLVTGYNTSNWEYWYRDYSAGTYTGIDTNSAMYFFTTTSGQYCTIADDRLLIQDDLVFNVDAFWPTSAPNDGVWYDIMGQSNFSLSNQGSVSYNNGSGRTGKYFLYNGSSRSFASHSAAFDTPDGFTAGAWVYTNSNSQTGRIFQKDEASSTRVWEFGNNGGNMRSEVWSSNGNTLLLVGTTVPIGAWHHMVLSASGNGNVDMYQNGVKTATGSIGTAASTLRTASTGLYLGGSWGGGEYYNGVIAMAYLYKKKLTDTEILENHDRFKGAFGL